jgi:hypothetical protein
MRFHVADTLTGRIVGRLEPITWEVTEPVTGSTSGWFDAAAVGSFSSDLVSPVRRQIAVELDSGAVLTGGPIPTPAERADDGLVRVPFLDWRGWWYRALLWPNTDGTRRDYFATNREQMTILADLAVIGLDHPAAPANMIVDGATASGVTRTRTFRMFSKVGDLFDDIARAERGPDWWTYLVRDGATLTPHTAFAYPYRTLRDGVPVVIRHKVGEAGNGRMLGWPAGQERANVVYGVGSGAPPDQGWSVAESEDVATGTELAWPEVLTLSSETRTRAQAFEHALARLEGLAGGDGTITVTVPADAPPVGEYGPGDLARLVVDDGWRSVDLLNARILSRTIRGIGEHITDVTLTLDLNYQPGDSGEVPGEAVEEAI